MSEQADTLPMTRDNQLIVGACRRVRCRTGAGVTGDASGYRVYYTTPLERRVDQLIRGSRART